MSDNIVYYVVKDENNKVLGVKALINGVNDFYPIQGLLRNNVHFKNAVVCNNGIIRGKGCNLKFESLEGNKKIIRVYHGSQIESFVPTYGLGEVKHDYGRGFYLTQNKGLAKEWAVSVSQNDGFLHSYDLDLTGLSVFNFNDVSPLNWLAELMSHRDADNSARYKKLSKVFIKKYGVDTSRYDIIYGWRADSSYFSIAKRFVRNEIDYNLISDLFHLGGLENQICLKSRKAFASIKEVGMPERVDKSYGLMYTSRDRDARKKMTEIIESDLNTMTRGFDYVIGRNIND